jgi:hypothetical protein
MLRGAFRRVARLSPEPPLVVTKRQAKNLFLTPVSKEKVP